MMKKLLLLLLPLSLFGQEKTMPRLQLNIASGSGLLDQLNKPNRFNQCNPVWLSIGLMLKQKTELGLQFSKAAPLMDPEYIDIFITGYSMRYSPLRPYLIHYEKDVSALHYQMQSIFFHGTRYIVSGEKLRVGIKVLAGYFSGTMPPYDITVTTLPGNGGNPPSQVAGFTSTKVQHGTLIYGTGLNVNIKLIRGLFLQGEALYYQYHDKDENYELGTKHTPKTGGFYNERSSVLFTSMGLKYQIRLK